MEKKNTTVMKLAQTALLAALCYVYLAHCVRTVREEENSERFRLPCGIWEKWTICSFPMNIAGSRTEAPEERRCMPGRIC